MIPRFTPMVTAWARSWTPSLVNMLFMWPFTVSSVMESLAAISLFAFPRGQGFIGGVLGEFRGHLGRDPLSAGMYQTDDLHQVFAHQTFEQVGSSAGLDCAQYLDISRIRRQNDDSRSREFPSNRDHGVEAVHFRHL